MECDTRLAVGGGIIHACGEAWTFKTHGADLTFFGLTSARIVDAHKFAEHRPAAVDAWRAVQFAESTGTRFLSYKGVEYGASDERAVEACLTAMATDGLIAPLPYGRLWVPSCDLDQLPKE